MSSERLGFRHLLTVIWPQTDYIAARRISAIYTKLLSSFLRLFMASMLVNQNLSTRPLERELTGRREILGTSLRLVICPIVQFRFLKTHPETKDIATTIWRKPFEFYIWFVLQSHVGLSIV